MPGLVQTASAVMPVEDEDLDSDDEPIGCPARRLSDGHAAELMSLIGQIHTTVDKHGADCPFHLNHDAERIVERFIRVTDLYQEQPQLLDPLLEQMLRPLLEDVRAEGARGCFGLRGDLAFKFLHHIVKVRGPKTVVRRLPHQPGDLQVVLGMLENADALKCSFEGRRVLLLWMEILISIPFDLKRFDGGDAESTPIVDRIMAAVLPYLDQFTAARLAAAKVLAYFVARPDVKQQHLQPLIWNSVQELESLNWSDFESNKRVAGLATLLAQVLKHAKREDLLPCADRLLTTVVAMPFTSGDTLLRKLGSKLVQRIGLVFLKPRIALWRYKRGNRCLLKTLGTESSTNEEDATKSLEAEENYDIPELQLAQVLQYLLEALRDKDNVVRWNAAKGVGRVTARLGRNLADDVVGSLLELFATRETDCSWHGGCLALAELGRRGYLLPERLNAVVPVLVRALVFERRQGRYSIGGHVRDAACYLCWSLARAYDRRELMSHVDAIAAALLTVAVFDREVNVRRAASAAFQENVGRQGTFPHGINILTVVDYQAVGKLSYCYRKLSVFVASFAQYAVTVVEYLLNTKIGHWDQSIRLLAAEALHNLTPLKPHYFCDVVLPSLFESAVGADMFAKQGAIFAIGNVAAALLSSAEYSHLLTDTLRSQVIALLTDLTNCFATKTGGASVDTMRTAFNVAAECLTGCTGLSLSADDVRRWHDALDLNLKHINPNIRDGACRALRLLWQYYDRLEEGRSVVDNRIRVYRSSAQTATTEAELHAALLAVGCLSRTTPPSLVADAVAVLVTHCAHPLDKHRLWVDARVGGLDAIGYLGATFGYKDLNQRLVMDCLLKCMDDYTLGSRGDIGRLAREAAMLQARKLVTSNDTASGDSDSFKTLISRLIQQSCEKIDSTRLIAADVLRSVVLLPASSHWLTVEEHRLLTSVYGSSEASGCNDWRRSVVAFPRLAPLLHLPSPFRYRVLMGFIVSAGGITESTMKAAADVLSEFMNEVQDDRTVMDDVWFTVADIFTDHQGLDRVVLPLLVVLEQIFSIGCLESYRYAGDSCKAFNTILRLTLSETILKRSPRKILKGLPVLGGFLQFDSSTTLWRTAASELASALLHIYPAVRRAASERLYEALLTHGCLDNHNELVLSVLCETDWDLKPEELAPVQTEITSLLGI